MIVRTALIEQKILFDVMTLKKLFRCSQGRLIRFNNHKITEE